MKTLYITVILFLIVFVSIVLFYIDPIGVFLYPVNPDRNAEVVKLVLSIIGGIGVLLGLYIAHKRAVITEKSVDNQSKQFEHAQKSQIDERFKNAVEHLGSDKEAIILGGVVELHQIAQVNEETYGKVVFNILTSYVRSQTDCLNVDPKEIKHAVIQTICDYLFKDKEHIHYPYKDLIANLESVNLNTINLDNADLSGTQLYDSFLPSCKNTNYEKANLRSCVFFNGNIENNNFKKALRRFTEMNLKKNQSLYTSLVDDELKPPYLSIGEGDVIDIEHIALNMLSRAKEPILNLDESLFTSLNINKKAIKKHDNFIWVRRMNTLQLVYKDHVKEIQKKDPYYNSIMEEEF